MFRGQYDFRAPLVNALGHAGIKGGYTRLDQCTDFLFYNSFTFRAFFVLLIIAEAKSYGTVSSKGTGFFQHPYTPIQHIIQCFDM